MKTGPGGVLSSLRGGSIPPCSGGSALIRRRRKRSSVVNSIVDQRRPRRGGAVQSEGPGRGVLAEVDDDLERAVRSLTVELADLKATLAEVRLAFATDRR